MGVNLAFHQGGFFSPSYGPYEQVVVPIRTSAFDYEYDNKWKKAILAYAKKIGLPSREPLQNNGYDVQYFLGIKELFADEIDLQGIKELFEEATEDEESSIYVIEQEIKHFENVVTTKSTGLIERLKEIQTTHFSYNQFMWHCDPLVFVIADFYGLKSKLYTRTLTALFTSFIILDGMKSVGLRTYDGPRFVFDPGGFEDESF